MLKDLLIGGICCGVVTMSSLRDDFQPDCNYVRKNGSEERATIVKHIISAIVSNSEKNSFDLLDCCMEVNFVLDVIIYTM